MAMIAQLRCCAKFVYTSGHQNPDVRSDLQQHAHFGLENMSPEKSIIIWRLGYSSTF